ncbi:PTS sugar transporter subunit IIA [Streptomyces canarius]
MAKKADGSTALAAVAGFLVYYGVLRQFPETCPAGAKVVATGCQASNGTVSAYTYQNPGVFGGIVMGLLAAFFWARYHRTKLVDWLGFFNGRRLVPIITAFVAILFAGSASLVWPPVGDALAHFGEWLPDAGSWRRGPLRRREPRALPVGLHQFLNTVPSGSSSATTPTPDGDRRARRHQPVPPRRPRPPVTSSPASSRS